MGLFFRKNAKNVFEAQSRRRVEQESAQALAKAFAAEKEAWEKKRRSAFPPQGVSMPEGGGKIIGNALRNLPRE